MTLPPDLADLRVRVGEAADTGSVARLFARLNATPATRCLHAGGGSADPADVRRGLMMTPGTRIVVAERVADGELVAAVALPAPPASLWGPAVSPVLAGPVLVGGALLTRLSAGAPGFPSRLDAFPDEENATLRRTLRDFGFREGQQTHVFVAPRPTSVVAGPFGEELRERHAAAFARLHEETFPTSPEEGTDADTLLADAAEGHRRIFIVPDASGLRLLGYVCTRVGEAPREGFIEFLAVRDAARGRGVGGQLLRTAQRCFFEELDLPQAALCVSERRAARGGARRLYEREGFKRRFTGVGMRCWR